MARLLSDLLAEHTADTTDGRNYTIGVVWLRLSSFGIYPEFSNFLCNFCKRTWIRNTK